jgi:GGDEF domain-containing protein
MTASVLTQDARLDRLPGRSAAETALHEASGSTLPANAVVLIPERVLSLSEELGYAAGEQLLEACCRKWEELLAPGEQLFRWSFSSFLVVPVVGDPAAARRRFDRLTKDPVICEVTLPHGDFGLAAGYECMVFRLEPHETTEAICRRIDHSVATLVS